MRSIERIVAINKQGMTIFLVEQNARIALQNSHYAYILEDGEISLEGNAEDLRDDEL